MTATTRSQDVKRKSMMSAADIHRLDVGKLHLDTFSRCVLTPCNSVPRREHPRAGLGRRCAYSTEVDSSAPARFRFLNNALLSTHFSIADDTSRMWSAPAWPPGL